MKVERQLHLVDSLPERLSAGMPHRLHVPRARQFETLEAHFRDAVDLLHGEIDAAVEQAGLAAGQRLSIVTRHLRLVT